MGQALTEFGLLDADWLTGALRDSGHLGSGRVVGVRTSGVRTQLVSVTARLHIEYSDDVSDSMPSSLFLKTNRPDLGGRPGLGRKEVEFYRTVAPRMNADAAPRCYGAEYSADTDRFHLLLEDLSESHFCDEWPLPPTVRRCEQLVDCLASLHAAWWDRTDLAAAAPPPTDTDLEAYSREIGATLPEFLKVLGDRISARHREIYEGIRRPLFVQFSKRLVGGRNLTLLHGDPHTLNMMLPVTQDGRARLVDWEDWRGGAGAMDLAHLIALHWYPDRRARLEPTLVRRYHDGLRALGVSGYAWEECWDDYRLYVLRNALIPIGQWKRGLPAYIWFPHVERSMLAIEDLDCLDLL